jgi:hypothetical protein
MVEGVVPGHDRVTPEGRVEAQHLAEFLVHWRRRQREVTGALRALRPSSFCKPYSGGTSDWLYETAFHGALGLSARFPDPLVHREPVSGVVSRLPSKKLGAVLHVTGDGAYEAAAEMDGHLQ